MANPRRSVSVLLWVCASTMIFPTQTARGQPNDPEQDLADLAPLIGTWESQLDPKYRDHPAIKRFNPDLKPSRLSFSWGVGKEVIHVRAIYVDRPNEGDFTPYIEGIIVRSPSDGEIRFLSYNSPDDQYYEGNYRFLKNGDIERYYITHFRNGPSTRFRESWVWADGEKTEFDWKTETMADGQYRPSDIVVKWTKLHDRPE